MKALIISNNPLVYEKYERQFEIHMIEVPLLDILKEARNMIHGGHRLLTHPLSGSVKPNETIYKSVMLSKEKGKLMVDSLLLIENAIETVEKFMKTKNTPLWNEQILADFREIDYTLLKSAIESMEQCVSAY